MLAFFNSFYYDDIVRISLVRDVLISLSVSDEFHWEDKCVRSRRAVEGLPEATCAADRKLHMEEMYEVLKFIEHGTHCRRSLDCVQGVSLMRRLKEHPGMDRRGLLIWIREIARCMEQYHRSGSGQDYRYLNPYSIIVTEEDGLMLLDLEAPDNASVIKQMQTGAVRNHFVRPVYDLGISRNHEADLFAYGKTIQFMLAYTEVRPALTRMDEIKLQRVIGRCTGKSGKRYGGFGEVLKALPGIPKIASKTPVGKLPSLKRIAGGVGLGVAACLCLCVMLGVEKKSLVKAEEEAIYQEALTEGEKKAKKEYEKKLAALEKAQKDERAAKEAAEQIKAAGEAAQETAEKLRVQQLEQELLAAYEGLLAYEADPVRAEEIRQKKAELENTP